MQDSLRLSRQIQLICVPVVTRTQAESLVVDRESLLAVADALERPLFEPFLNFLVQRLATAESMTFQNAHIAIPCHFKLVQDATTVNYDKSVLK